MSEGARHPIDPVHSLTTPFSRHCTTNVIEPDARHVGLAPTHWRATPRPDGSNCLRAPATRILCQLLATIGAVTCALRETTPKRLTATGLALPSRYRNRGRFSAKTLVHRHTPSVLARPIRTVRTRRRCGAQDFDDCSEKRVRARELVLENKGNRTVIASLDGEIRDGRHQMQVRVYFEDTDSGQIVYHANFLRFMERGRTNYLRLLGTDQHALLQEARDDAPGFTFVVRSMTIDFLKPAVLDDVLDVVTLPQEVRGASVTLLQECRRSDDLLVTARVRVAFISGVSRWSICR